MQTKTLRFKSRPRTFRSITGLSVEKFNQLYEKLVPIYAKSELKRLRKLKRQRKTAKF